MTVKKVPIDPDRVRKIPQEGFSWIDRRFIRMGFINRLPSEAILLYFFLTAVSDAQGLSFYADPTVGKILKLDPEKLTQARAWLCKAELILYRYPLYQVLEFPKEMKIPTLPSPSSIQPRQPPRDNDPPSISKLINEIMNGKGKW